MEIPIDGIVLHAEVKMDIQVHVEYDKEDEKCQEEFTNGGTGTDHCCLCVVVNVQRLKRELGEANKTQRSHTRRIL